MNKMITAAGLLAIGITTVITACKKKDKNAGPDPVGQTCTIASYTDSLSASGNHFNIAYNNSKIASITGKELNYNDKTFTYSGNTILINTPQQVQIDSVILNSKGSIGTIFTRNYSSTTYRPLQMIYDANDHLIYALGLNSFGPNDSTTYEWSNGDMIKQSNPNYGYINYTYYTDHTSADGDHLAFEQFSSYGAVSVKNAHIVKSQYNSYSGATFSYSYTYNGNTVMSVQTLLKAAGDTTNTDQGTRYYHYICP